MSDGTKRFMNTDAVRDFVRKRHILPINNDTDSLALLGSLAANQLLLSCDILDELREINRKTPTMVNSFMPAAGSGNT